MRHNDNFDKCECGSNSCFAVTAMYDDAQVSRSVTERDNGNSRLLVNLWNLDSNNEQIKTNQFIKQSNQTSLIPIPATNTCVYEFIVY